MKKALLTLTFCYACMLMIAASAHADATDGTSAQGTFKQGAYAEACHLTIDSQITMDADSILVTANNGDQLLIKGDNQLLVNNNPFSINSRQQPLVDEYQRQLRTTIPAVVDIALEAVDIGLTAVSEVFSALVGAEPPADLRLALDDFRAEINARMAHEGQIVRLDGDSADLSGPALDKITTDLQDSLQSAVASSIGAIIMSMGQSIEAGEGSLDERLKNFAQRFERLGAELDAKVRSRTGILEERASGLCGQLAELQVAEQNLQAAVPGLQAFSLIHPNTQGTGI